jgi:signal transduction histidine kinase
VILLFFKQLVNWGYVRFTGNLTVFVLWLVITAGMALDSDENNPAFMGYIIVVICAGLILNWRASLGWSFLCILTGGILLLLGQSNLLPRGNPNNQLLSIWVAQTLYIVTSAILLSQAIRKIDEAFAKAQHALSERKHAEAEREKVIQELEAKNAELERFTYTASHDLKSPLITISGFLGLLEADARSGNMEKFKKDLQRINDATEKMKYLLDELLELSRVGRIINSPSEIPFAKIVQDALALVRGRLMAGHIQVKVQNDLPIVHGDHQRLVEVIQNLIDNAAKFMGDQPEPEIEIGIHAENSGCVFFVRDNGMGIDPEHHAKVFGLFDKLDPRSEGTGVGLALVKRIVEVHGGRIWVESKGRDQGSMFCFTLPIQE